MLRAGTAGGHNDLIMETSLRHPWLKLRPVS
jgi:hypothetical protein